MKICIIGNINDSAQNGIRIAQAWTLQRHNVRNFPFSPRSIDKILKFNPVFCLVTQGRSFDHRVISTLRDAGIFLVQWIPDEYGPGDSPGGLWLDKIKGLYDLALVETRGIIPKLKAGNYFDDVVWVPQFFDPRFHGNYEKRLQYYENSDLGFVGGVNPAQSTIRLKFLRQLIKDGYALKIAGGTQCLWAGIAGIDPDFSDDKFIGEGVLVGPDLAKFFLRVKINLNFVNDLLPQYELGLSNRAFKCTGSGGFLLTQEVDGLADMLIPGEHCVTYNPTCYDDLIEKIEYFLKNGDKRERIALQGQQHVLTNYNIDKITELFIDEIKKRL